MESNKKKGIVFLISGVATYVIIPYLLHFIGLSFIPGYIYLIIAIILIAIGVKFLLNKNGNEEIDLELPNTDNTTSSASKEISQQTKKSNMNKVVNVTLTGGIIGLVGDSPQNSLNRRISKENKNGWRVIQVIPSSSGNLLLILLRLLLLVVTLFFYTTANGYYVIMEKND
jgi:hypothetical protein